MKILLLASTKFSLQTVFKPTANPNRNIQVQTFYVLDLPLLISLQKNKKITLIVIII